MKRIGLVVPTLHAFQMAVDCIWSATRRKPPGLSISVYIEPCYRDGWDIFRAWNNGITAAVDAGCEYVVVSNDDVLWGRSAIRELVFQAKRSDNDVVMWFANNVYGHMSEENLLKGMVHPDRIDLACAYSHFLIRRDFFDRCGQFDEIFSPQWGADIDMDYRIQLLGLRFQETLAPVFHYKHVTTSKFPEANDVGLESYRVKWGSKSGRMFNSYDVGKHTDEEFVHPYNDPSLPLTHTGMPYGEMGWLRQKAP